MHQLNKPTSALLFNSASLLAHPNTVKRRKKIQQTREVLVTWHAAPLQVDGFFVVVGIRSRPLNQFELLHKFPSNLVLIALLTYFSSQQGIRLTHFLGVVMVI